MRLKTYRINLVGYVLKRYCLHYLYDNALKDDPTWHFFLDEGGITLRFSPKFKKKVDKLLKGDHKQFKEEADYDPSVDEYEGIRFVGSDWIPLFNAISVMSVKYPPSVTKKVVLERMNHALVNQMGEHSFYEEAKMYAELALGRAELGALTGRGSSKP